MPVKALYVEYDYWEEGYTEVFIYLPYYVFEEISIDQGIVNVDVNFEVTVATVQQISVDVSSIELSPIDVEDFEVL